MLHPFIIKSPQSMLQQKSRPHLPQPAITTSIKTITQTISSAIYTQTPSYPSTRASSPHHKLTTAPIHFNQTMASLPPSQFKQKPKSIPSQLPKTINLQNSLSIPAVTALNQFSRELPSHHITKDTVHPYQPITNSKLTLHLQSPDLQNHSQSTRAQNQAHQIPFLVQP